MTELADLPKTIQRWCCTWGKSCGLTTLYLEVEATVEWSGTEPNATLTFTYRRGNGDSYFSWREENGGWRDYAWSPRELAEKLEETALDPEEVRKHNESYGTTYEL